MAFEFAHPGALTALAVPALVAWLATRRRRAASVPTGSVAIWREVAQVSRSAARARRRMPWALVLLLAALVSAVLGLAGPGLRQPAARARWRVVVDRSPSMYLPYDGVSGTTRFERALQSVVAMLPDGLGDVQWIAASGEFTVARVGLELPPEWRAAPRGAWSEPRWALFDDARTVWLTDGEIAARRASVCASGGAACPGVVAATTAGRWVWDGARLALDERSPVGTVAVSRATELDGSALARAFDAWAVARGFERTPAPGVAALVLRVAHAGEVEVLEVGRDGWSATVEGRAVEPARTEPSRSWLTAQRPDGVTIDVVRWSAGEIVLGWSSILELRGDAAAFAVSWAALFDTAFAPLEGVSASERSAAREAGIARRDESQMPPAPARTSLSALLAVCAGALAAAAMVVRAQSSSES